MAIKTFLEAEGRVRYCVSWLSRSSMNRDICATKQEQGVLEGLDEAAVKKKLASIEYRLRNEAQREMIRREGAGSKWLAVVDQWEEALKAGTGSLTTIKPATAEGYVTALRDFTEAWMDRHAADITAADVLETLAKMKNEGYSECRMYNVKVAINQCYKWAILKRLIRGVTQSPGIGISVSRKSSKRPESLNHSQITHLLSEADRQQHEWRSVWRLVVLTGLRSGEAYELRGKDIDREEKRIFLERKYNFESKDIEDLKDAEWRQVPINAELDELLIDLGVESKGPEDYILPRIRAWTNGEAARILRAFCGVVEVPSICFHTLRALWATQLLRANVAQRTVMEMGGWADPETMERYVRRAGIEIQGATDKLQFKKERPGRVLSLVHSA